MRLGWIIALAASVLSAHAEDVSFRGKTLTMVIGSAPGGGTDLSGRLIARFLQRYLPDGSQFVIRNIPGAEGITSLNYFTQQAAADGTFVVMGSSTLADPMVYRRPQSKSDPLTLEMIGGVGRGGKGLFVNKKAEHRLRDKSLPPVIMGSLVGVPRSGMQMTAWGIEFLNWNAKWVVGYHGTPDLFLALDRGEIDMTSDSGQSVVEHYVGSGAFSLIAQSGSLNNSVLTPRAGFYDAPLLADLVKGKFSNSAQEQSFRFWNAMTMIDKWLALPAKTPAPYVAAYRAAFDKVLADPEFIAAGKAMGEELSPMAHADVVSVLRILAGTPPEAIAFTTDMLRRQGVEP